MFEADVYSRRRNRLKEQVDSGLILFLGNEESPMNYADNLYRFRQDGSFLYYWGHDTPGMAAIIDVDEGREVLFGHDPTLDDIVWTGPQPSLSEKARRVGVADSLPVEKLPEAVSRVLTQGRTVHFLPPYRSDTFFALERLLGRRSAQIKEQASPVLIDAVIAQREVKEEREIAEIETAVNISGEMHTLAMRCARPGVNEREVAGALEGVALAHGRGVSFPIIFSIHGETLHNHDPSNRMQAGNIAVCDCGATSPLHYAGDITRTIPVGGRFTDRQKDIYSLVLKAQMEAIAAIKAGVRFKDVHLLAATVQAQGLKELGLMKGDVDEAVAAGAHALFFPHGLGHMMGLDVHDMESLGEDRVGYDDDVRRSAQFGLAYLRLGKSLRSGFVLTVEPGLYFIPTLIDQWKAEGKHAEYINYDRVEQYKGFGGIRIEDDVLVLDDGYRVLGKPIPKTVEAVEAEAAR
ncbi:MAG: aminopeptidase P family protein [Rhodothermales bacterium]